MTDWKKRLLHLGNILEKPDPRPEISRYHNMPYAIFRYPPEEEFAVRAETSRLRTRLEQRGKRVTKISLAEQLRVALEALPFDSLVEAERGVGLTEAIETAHAALSQYTPLDDLVLKAMPPGGSPETDVVFIVRAGALFPMYRTSALLEQMMGKVHIPTILFYPGELDGAAGLSFMGVLDAEHNYRPKIF
jgi:hypothetical protein